MGYVLCSDKLYATRQKSTGLYYFSSPFSGGGFKSKLPGVVDQSKESALEGAFSLMKNRPDYGEIEVVELELTTKAVIEVTRATIEGADSAVRTK